MKPRTDPYSLDFYEGLCHKTAAMYVPYVEEDFEDIVQVLRLKAWRALQTYDAARSTLSVERYVFGCIRNQCKDLVRKKRRNELFIEDVAPVRWGDEDACLRDRFERRYLSTEQEQVYGGVEDEPPLVPSTLDERERQILCLLYRSYPPTDVARSLSLTRAEVTRSLESIRAKMADWSPRAQGGRALPLPA